MNSLIKVTFITGLLMSSNVLFAEEMLAERHKAMDISCLDCHGVTTPKPASVFNNQGCINCHGSIDEVAEVTKVKNLYPDPHYNHLVELGCTECHQGHQPSVNMCNDCHNIDFNTP